MLIQDVINDFILYEVTAGSTLATIRHYKIQLKAFVDFFGNQDVALVTYKTYEKYILYLRSKYKESSGFVGKREFLSSRTIKTYASALKTFLCWSYKNKYISEDVAALIKMPRFKKKLIKILSFEDIAKLVTSFDVGSFLGCRDLLIFCFMLESRFKTFRSR